MRARVVMSVGAIGRTMAVLVVKGRRWEGIRHTVLLFEVVIVDTAAIMSISGLI